MWVIFLAREAKQFDFICARMVLPETHPTPNGQAHAHGDNGAFPVMESTQAQTPGFLQLCGTGYRHCPSRFASAFLALFLQGPKGHPQRPSGNKGLRQGARELPVHPKSCNIIPKGSRGFTHESSGTAHTSQKIILASNQKKNETKNISVDQNTSNQPQKNLLGFWKDVPTTFQKHQPNRCNGTARRNNR